MPYITAYDWLEFQRIVLDGHITNGRSISLVHLLYGEPKVPLEKMVYVFEYGASPGGQGASNTVFFVDAKLAFGWLGVLAYCLVFTFCAACIFTSQSGADRVEHCLFLHCLDQFVDRDTAQWRAVHLRCARLPVG
ncbi:hypothetical protein G3O07_04870 [Pseudomonas laurentiana]|uniref:Uncharacterized protein n=1 Tax=Pseudomonas laurentiana TaxID=2364649 RepID=A0A6I5RNJ0_9PSED|nr:hypothetical protein [Pseudomonas laurentiana]